MPTANLHADPLAGVFVTGRAARLRPAGQVVACISVLMAGTATADIVRLADGSLHAGRAVENADSTVTLRTGTRDGPKAMSLPRDRIVSIARAFDEAAIIESTTQPDILERLAAGYFHADEKTLAVQCVDRFIAVEPRGLEKALVGAEPAFRAFWNRTLLDRRIARADVRGTTKWLQLAEWARSADLPDDATRLLRRAWCFDRRSRPALELARSWNVVLEPWVQIELTSALRESLFTEAISDEGTSVSAAAGKRFLTIPLWYETAVTPRELGVDILGAADRRAYYGLRLLKRRPVERADLSDGPIYERVTLVRQPNGEAWLSARNTHEPRRRENDRDIQPRRRARPDLVFPSGWCALVVEVADTASELTLSWDDGGHETIDLNLLRMASSSPGAADTTSPDDRPDARALAALDAQSPAMIELAVAMLAGMRNIPGSDAASTRADEFDPKVLNLARRHERQVRLAAWHYVASNGLSPAAAREAQRADAEFGPIWLALIRSQLAGATESARSAASDLAAALVRSAHADVCEAAFDLLIELDPSRDWGFVSSLSGHGRLAALARLDRLPRDVARVVLRALAENARSREIGPLAGAAARLGLTIDHPDDPVFRQWFAVASVKKRRALLAMLRAADLTALLHAQAMRELLDAAHGKGQPDGMGREADLLVLEQCRRLREHRGRAPAAFPVLVGLRARDHVLEALERLAAGSDELAAAARHELLLRGHAERAERALDAAADGDDARLSALLDELARAPDVAGAPAWFGLLGRMARPERASHADAVFTRLNAAAAGVDPARRWRVLAAVKSGADIDALDALVAALEPPVSGKANRWINALGHLDRASRKELAAAKTATRRRDILAAADLRLARQVSGRYGVIAVVELCTRLPTRPPGAPADSSPTMRWSPPRRITLDLPPVDLQPDNEGEGYRVLHGESELGRGVRRADLPRGSRIASSPDAYLFRMVEPLDEWLGPEGWGWPAYVYAVATAPASAARAAGPVVLPGNRPVLSEPRPETMTLSLTDYLREALAGPEAAGVLTESAITMPPEAVPDPLRITLRYAAFGSYYGVAASRPPSLSSSRDAHLLNLMLVLEKIDDRTTP